MVRKLSKKNMLIALFLTLGIFVIGIMSGIMLSEKRVSYGEKQLKQQRLDLDSLQLQYTLIGQGDFSNSCTALSSAIDINVKNLMLLGNKIEKYSSDMNFNEEDYTSIKREYTLAQIRFWMLANKANHLCNKDLVTLIYFYSNDVTCFDCSTQSRILTHLKGQLKDKLLIFSIDTSFTGEPLIEMFKTAYNITDYPSILINQELISGLNTESVLKSKICSLYLEPDEYCS